MALSLLIGMSSQVGKDIELDAVSCQSETDAVSE